MPEHAHVVARKPHVGPCPWEKDDGRGPVPRPFSNGDRWGFLPQQKEKTCLDAQRENMDRTIIYPLKRLQSGGIWESASVQSVREDGLSYFGRRADRRRRRLRQGRWQIAHEFPDTFSTGGRCKTGSYFVGHDTPLLIFVVL
jgi:hypothetical protein